jgi:hypothetical protein
MHAILRCTKDGCGLRWYDELSKLPPLMIGRIFAGGGGSCKRLQPFRRRHHEMMRGDGGNNESFFHGDEDVVAVKLNLL